MSSLRRSPLSRLRSNRPFSPPFCPVPLKEAEREGKARITGWRVGGREGGAVG